MARALSVARRGGAEIVGLAGDDAVRLRWNETETVLFGTLFRPSRQRWGPTNKVKQLRQGLEGVFGPVPYAVHLRRPLGPDADICNVVRAVRMWLASGDGSHAEYDDDDVSVALTRLDREADGIHGGCALEMGPATSLKRLAEIHVDLMSTAERVSHEHDGTPIIVVPIAERPWRFPCSSIRHLLYGACAEVACRQGRASDFVAVVSDRSGAMYAQPACNRLLSTWWLSPSDDGAPMLGCAFDNPWSHPRAELDVPLRRFVVEQSVGNGRVQMRWCESGEHA